jgi:hypothetical protein
LNQPSFSFTGHKSPKLFKKKESEKTGFGGFQSPEVRAKFSSKQN